ncbi:MAG TPA: DUF1194 domain-containing protein [Stellaceae bacterium]|nr:DUF1194 domain-containing protein [Stellaceae bacterium]
MLLSALAFWCLGLAAAYAERDLALVLAVDVSESVDDQEYELQHEGIARAFENENVIQAIHAGSHGGIEVLVLEWSDRDKQVVTVDWTLVQNASSARAFAAKVRASTRSSSGLTAIGDALLAAKASFLRLPEPAARQVIDISGDGMANIGPDPATVRDVLVAQGVTINGLAILKTEPWLDQYYSVNVIGGPGAFLLQIEDFPAFVTAIESKLLAEISSLPPGRHAVRATRTSAQPAPRS